MVAAANQLIAELEHKYAMVGAAIDLKDFLRGQIPSDDIVADLIEIDGRERLARGLSVDLRRYLDAVPGLAGMPVSLDAAIDFSLRSLSGNSSPTAEAIQTLVSRYPDFREEIQSAAMLGEGMWSTSATIEGARPRFLQLPHEVGPVLESGRRRYELRERLGAGSHGAVYLAADRQLSETGHPAWVAVKVLARPRSEALRQRIIDEATKARRVNHPNVVRVLDRGVTDSGDEFIVYEYVNGGDLASLLKREPGWLDPRGAAALIAKVARGVQAAHSAGLVHCDLKPSNIMLTREREPKVADFGIAVRVGEVGELGQPVLGNLAFIAPEQYRGDPGCMAPPADVYALGGVLYHLVTGALPSGDSSAEISRNHRAAGAGHLAAPVRPHAAGDPDLAAICDRALAAQPERRHASADGLASDLEAFVRYEPVLWTRPSLGRRLRLLARRQPAVVLVGGFLVVSIIAGTGVVVHLRESARAAALKQELRSERLISAEQARRIRETTQTIDGLTNSLLRAKGGRLDENWFPLLTCMESVMGPILFSPDAPEVDIWSSRIEAAETRLARDAAEGHAPGIETLFWQSTTAFWHIRVENYDRAVELAEQARQEWEGRIAGDRWLEYIDCLWATAVTLRAAKPDAARPADAVLQRAFQALTKGEKSLDGVPEGGALRKVVLGALVDLTAPELLNDPVSRATYSKQLANLK